MKLEELAASLGVAVETARSLVSAFASASERDLAELERAAAAADAAACARLAHHIRGAAAALGLASIVHDADAIEEGAQQGSAAGWGPQLARIRAALAELRGSLEQEPGGGRAAF